MGHTENQTHNYNCEGMWKTRIQTIDRKQTDILLWLTGDFIQRKKVSLRFPRRGQLRSAGNKGRGGHLSSLRSRSRVGSVPGWWAVPLPRLAGEVNRGGVRLVIPGHGSVRAAADGGQGRSGPWSWGGTRGSRSRKTNGPFRPSGPPRRRRFDRSISDCGQGSSGSAKCCHVLAIACRLG